MGTLVNDNEPYQATEQPLAKTKPGLRPFTKLLIGLVICLFVVNAFMPSTPSPQRTTTTSSGSFGGSPVDALQVLVDEVNVRLGGNILGKVTSDGRHAVIIVEADYFKRMDDPAKRVLLTEIHNQWVSKLYGKQTTFKTWDGKVIADLE